MVTDPHDSTSRSVLSRLTMLVEEVQAIRDRNRGELLEYGQRAYQRVYRPTARFRRHISSTTLPQPTWGVVTVPTSATWTHPPCHRHEFRRPPPQAEVAKSRMPRRRPARQAARTRGYSTAVPARAGDPPATLADGAMRAGRGRSARSGPGIDDDRPHADERSSIRSDSSVLAASELAEHPRRLLDEPIPVGRDTTNGWVQVKAAASH